MQMIATTNEARHFWRLSQEVAKAKAAHASHDVMAEWIDEIEVLREMTDWPYLKERCNKLLADIKPEQLIA